MATYLRSALTRSKTNQYLKITSDADSDPWIGFVLKTSDQDPDPDPYGEIRIRIQDMCRNMTWQKKIKIL